LIQVNVMKPSQTVLLLVIVVVIVFAVTFASMYLSPDRQGPSPKKGQKHDPSAQLTFPVRSYPPEGSGASQHVATEYGTKGHRDFWFENGSNREVVVGLNSKNCSCSEVELFLAPAEWRGQLDGVSATRAVCGSAGILDGIVTAVCAEQWTEDLTAKGENGRTLAARNGVPVPPGGYGFVRLSWEATRKPDPNLKGEMAALGVRPELLSADVWMQDPEVGGNVILQTRALLMDGVRLDVKELDAGLLGPGDSKRQLVRVWSSTRYQMEPPRIDVSGAPFVSCSKPEPLTWTDMAELIQRVGPVRSGYRMTISVREQMPDGSRFDEGFFTHQVTIIPRETFKLVDSLAVRVHGAVQGDITLVGGVTGVNMGTFAVRDGASSSITLQTDRNDVRLTLDEKKVPSFLKATLDGPTKEGEQRSWQLSVRIEPNQISGSFPRADSEVYRDSAIYLRVDGPVKRNLRIPVRGTATQ
jgi:hypothetical protein